MKFILNSVGAIKNATLELAPLTIVCGRNNSGKTYLTTAISEFLSNLREVCRVKSVEPVPGEDERAFVDLVKYVDLIKQKVKEAAESFANRSDILHGGSLSIKLDTGDVKVDKPAVVSTWTASTGGRAKYKVEKNGSILEISRRVTMDEGETQDAESRKKQWHIAFNTIINAYLFRQIYGGCLLGDVFSVNSERMGVVYFKDALDIAMRHQSRADDSSGDSGSLAEVVDQVRSDVMFPKVIVRMLNFVSWLGMRKKTGTLRVSKFGAEFESDLEKLSEGSYAIEDQGMVFSPKDAQNLVLNAKDSSSSVRSLFLLDQFVRYGAECGDVLFIDEPETNLHPRKQRELARLIAKLVNNGLKVFVTTHSDYFIREINILLMLAEGDKRLRNIADKYEYSQDELLRVDKVKPYRIEGGELHEMPMSQECGIEVSAFDDVIRDMNHIQHEILFGES